MLVRRTPFASTTEGDYRAFMANKSGEPMAGMFNDCVLRRLCNTAELSGLEPIFGGGNIAGFSTFGESFGLNLNQTLTAVFFFRTQPADTFRDEYVDSFVAHYGEFNAFFLRRHKAKLAGMSNVTVQQTSEYRSGNFSNRLDSANVDGSMVPVVRELNRPGHIMLAAEQTRDATARQLEALSTDPYASVGDPTTRLSERQAVIRQALDTLAGEAGRGFEVVADEVRMLAGNPRNSMGEIGQDISSQAIEIVRVAQMFGKPVEGGVEPARRQAPIRG